MAMWFKSIRNKSGPYQIEETAYYKVGPWEPWFAWRPVYIDGVRFWWTKVFRRSITDRYTIDSSSSYQYTLMPGFGALEDAQQMYATQSYSAPTHGPTGPSGATGATGDTGSYYC